jgi:PIN domain nuclease of toxin-antitoxin system
MRLLVDTHAFLWYVLDEPQLTSTARAAIDDPAADVYISPASFWEIAIKISTGKYQLVAPYQDFWERSLIEHDVDILPIEVRHTTMLLTMPYHHRDPFDRLIVAQAMAEQMPLVSADADVDAYGVRRIW